MNQFFFCHKTSLFYLKSLLKSFLHSRNVLYWLLIVDLWAMVLDKLFFNIRHVFHAVAKLGSTACIYLGCLHHCQHCTGHITTGSWKGRGNQYIEFVRILYCKLPTNSKQLPPFPLEAVPGIEPRPQRWEAEVF